jgi:hypothetical protein
MARANMTHVSTTHTRKSSKCATSHYNLFSKFCLISSRVRPIVHPPPLSAFRQ